MVRITELKPNDHHKSFHGKASVIETKNRIYLLSYSTIVASVVKRSKNFYRHWHYWSDTTQRHVNAFLDSFNILGGGKKWWCSLPVTKAPKESFMFLNVNNYKTTWY